MSTDSSPTKRITEIVCAMLIVAATYALLRPVLVEASGDRVRQCAENQRALYIALNVYGYDYDAILPPASVWNNRVAFATELGLYGVTSAQLRCPATRGGAYRNNPDVAGRYPGNFDADTTILLEDTQPHADGKRNTTFADGRIENNGVEQHLPNVETACLNRQYGLATALAQYAQDYDEIYPNQSTDAGIRAGLMPYVQSSRGFDCPATGTPYFIGQFFRGRSDADITPKERATLETFADARTHRSGNITRSYLGEATVQTGPRGTTTPASNPPQAPTEISRQKLRSLGSAMSQYASVNNGLLPPMDDLPTLRAALAPYVFSYDPSVFDPFDAPGAVPFVLNPALGNTPLSSYENPASVIWVRDVNRYRGRLISVGYLDGHQGTITP
ncbi:MAG: hypothetical protein H7Y38_19560 [Armatimonadetes bacterium]|nr:hypothetical protein [Armatimonadota bacterium]